MRIRRPQRGLVRKGKARLLAKIEPRVFLLKVFPGLDPALPMALLVITAFKHGLDGMKVVVDDYVHDEGNRFALNTLLLFLAIGGASLALFALGRIAFGGAA